MMVPALHVNSGRDIRRRGGALLPEVTADVAQAGASHTVVRAVLLCARHGPPGSVRVSSICLMLDAGTWSDSSQAAQHDMSIGPWPRIKADD